ncbi:MAG: hypothetical protein AAFR75_04430 [Pseudomonadota bacterium]
MIDVTMIILSIAAIGGFYLASQKMQEKKTPSVYAIAHGSLGAVGVVMLAPVVTNGGRSEISLALWVLAATLFGGLAIAALHMTRRKAPSLLIVAHGTAGMLGVFILASLAYSTN